MNHTPFQTDSENKTPFVGTSLPMLVLCVPPPPAPLPTGENQANNTNIKHCRVAVADIFVSNVGVASPLIFVSIVIDKLWKIYRLTARFNFVSNVGFEPRNSISYKVSRAPSEDSDQPVVVVSRDH